MKKRYRKTALSQYIVVGSVIVGLILLGYFSTFLMKTVPHVDHFALPWAAGRAWLLEGQNPYSPAIREYAAEAIADAGYAGELPAETLLIHPLINLLLYLPFSLIPYTISRVIWLIILVSCMGLLVYFSYKFSDWGSKSPAAIVRIVFFILWFPGVYSVLTGRFSIILILIMIYGLWLIKLGKFRTAGFLFALTVGSLPISLFILILAIIWSIARKEWTFLVAFLSGTAFLLVVSFLMLPSWPLDWLRTVLGTYQDLTWVQTPLMTLASVLPGIENFLSIGLHVVFGIFLVFLFVGLFMKSERIFVWNSLATFVITLLFQVRINLSGFLMLIPPLYLILRYSTDRWGLSGKLVNWFVLVLISVGSWLLILPEIRFVNTVSLTLMIVVFPLLVFLGMIWIRWWAVRLTSLPKI